MITKHFSAVLSSARCTCFENTVLPHLVKAEAVMHACLEAVSRKSRYRNRFDHG